MKKTLKDIEIIRLENVKMMGNKSYDMYDRAMMCLCQDMDEYVHSIRGKLVGDAKDILLEVQKLNMYVASYITNSRDTKEKEKAYFDSCPNKIREVMNNMELAPAIKEEISDYLNCFDEYYTYRRNNEVASRR